VKMWNEALGAVRAVDEDPAREGEEERAPTRGAAVAALLPYEALFSGEERWLEFLLGFAGLPWSSRMASEHRRLADSWSERVADRQPKLDAAAPGERGAPAGAKAAVEGAEEMKRDAQLVDYVRAHLDTDLRSWAEQRMEHQLACMPEVQRIAGDEDELPHSREELGERELERAQLLEEMRHPGRRAQDELEVLERRFVEVAGELARRGGRLRVKTTEQGHRGENAAEQMAWPTRAQARARPRITFLAPHQRATTGGVYVIEQFARYLATVADVCVAVRERPSREIPGVEVRWLEGAYGEPSRASAGLPEADVLVYPADLRDAAELLELPVSVGRPVMFFQGYGTPGSPVVEANLSAAREAVTIARWLQDVALARGVPCAYVPQGLDGEVFAGGRTSPAQRSPRVSLMTHRLDWKGLDDALEALAIVRARRPEVELALFGTESPGGNGASRPDPTRPAVEATFLPSPTRPEVAALLGTSAVHVVASWEEGFGLTGAEAIACGAALATTDTKGSRDYAIDGHTALVSAPRDPQALALNVLRLLEDAQLRARLVANGQLHLRTAMPPWEEAARRMALVLLDATAP
jgi:glycosyltransferase involved in cell wall biosynthesis